MTCCWQHRLHSLVYVITAFRLIISMKMNPQYNINSKGAILDNIRSLQKGSNGFDLRGIENENKFDRDGPILSEQSAFWIGFGFAKFLQGKSSEEGKEEENNNNLTVGIGRDSRLSGFQLTDWLAGGLSAGGVRKVTDVGLCTTPAMYYACCPSESYPNGPFHGGISVTASHLPSKWNGFKFFTSSNPTNIGSEGIECILHSLDELLSEEFLSRTVPLPYSHLHGSAPPSVPYLPSYAKFLQKTIRSLLAGGGHRSEVGGPGDETSPLKGLKVCVNAGNGAGGFLADCLAELGADTSSSIHLEPDGSFPNHIANPEDVRAIEITRQAVLQGDADIGICLDTDADRVGIVEGGRCRGNQNAGRLLNRNGLVALVSKIALRGVPPPHEGASSSERAVIVTDSATSEGVTKFIEDALGGRHVRYKKGYRYVIERAREEPGSVAAVECSGHGAWRDNGWVDDGCYTAVRIITELMVASYQEAESNLFSLSQLITELQEPIESVELRCNILGGRESMEDVAGLAAQTLREIADAVPSWQVEPINYEGLRVKVGDGTGWCMLRPSLHEPIISIQIESNLVDGVKDISCVLFVGLREKIPDNMLDLEPLLKTL